MPCLLCVACGMCLWRDVFVCLGVCVCVCVHVCVCTLHSLQCSLEIGRSCDSSSRMSWLDSGRPWGLLQCERAASDNLSSSLGDDSPPAVRPQSPAAPGRDVETRRSGLIKTTLCCRDARLQKPFLNLFFLLSFFFCCCRSRGWELRSTGGESSFALRVCVLEEEEEGESEFVDTDTDGIVYLLWPRLDFQCLTCCNPHSVRSAPRVAQTSHWCFSRTAMLPPLSLPPRHTWRGRHSEVSTGRERLQQPAKASLRVTENTHTNTHRPTHNTHTDCTSRGLLETNSNYRFCYSKSLTHRHFLLTFKHMVFISNLLCVVRLWDLWWKTEYERKTQRQGWFPDGQSGGCGLKSENLTHKHTQRHTHTHTHTHMHACMRLELWHTFIRTWSELWIWQRSV